MAGGLQATTQGRGPLSRWQRPVGRWSMADFLAPSPGEHVWQWPWHVAASRAGIKLGPELSLRKGPFECAVPILTEGTQQASPHALPDTRTSCSQSQSALLLVASSHITFLPH